MLAIVNAIGVPALGGQVVPLEFDAGAVVALDATAWFDLFYLRYQVTPAQPTVAEILAGADAYWIDTKDIT